MLPNSTKARRTGECLFRAGVLTPLNKLADQMAYPPRLFRAERAAAYVSMSTSTFLKLVEERVMPQAIKLHGMTIWDRFDLDAAVENLKEESAQRRNPIEEHYGVNKGG